MRLVLWRNLITISSILMLTACTDSSISSRDQITPTYLFYTAYITGAPDQITLNAVDPKDPANPVEVARWDNGMPAPTYFLGGTVEPATKTIADLHYRFIVYPVGTRLYRLGAHRSESLFANQVSNENFANVICDNWLATGTVGIGFDDYSNSGRSVLFYEKDPLDANACDDSGNEMLFMVRMGMLPSTVPLGGATLQNHDPISALYDSSGAIVGFLFHNKTTNELVYRDSDLDVLSASTVLTGVTSVNPLATDSSGNILLQINSVDLRVFNAGALSLSAVLFTDTVPASLTGFPILQDDNNFYYQFDDKIYRVRSDGSSSAEVVVDESGGTASLDEYIFLSRGKVVYHVDDSSHPTTPEERIRVVPISGGTPTTIATLPANASIKSLRASAGRVYVSIGAPTRRAYSISDSGGSPIVIDNAWWSGVTYHPRQPLFADVDVIGRNSSGFFSMARMRASTIYQIKFSGSGNTFHSYDADTSWKLVDYGVPTSDFDTIDVVIIGTSSYPPIVHGLANNDQTLVAFGGANSDDILFLHARNSNSVVRVTNDADNDDVYGLVGGCQLGRNAFDPLFPLMVMLAAIYLWRRRKVWYR